MNKIQLNSIKAKPKYLIAALAIMLITACADSRIVTLEESVKQEKNLADYDSDGVIKAREKCDGTIIGASIDNYGCGSQTAKIKPFKIDIKFEHNSYELPLSAYTEIIKLAEFLATYSEINVLIEGHTSKVGTAELNQELSKNRAKAVALMLEKDFKISKDRIKSIGYGDTRLKEIGDTEQAHAANRRIMAEVSHTENIDALKWTIYTVDQAN
jgi:outer membrane protein OmpA-like peptidoglycan-associated protein